MVFNRRSMSACSAVKASACFRVASAWSLEAFVAFESASLASASYLVAILHQYTGMMLVL